MNQVHIYVEGTNDRVFITSFLEEIFGLTITISGKTKNQIFQFKNDDVEGQISILKTWTGISKPFFLNQFSSNTEDGIQNIILLDADKSTNQGGFIVRKAEVEAVKVNSTFDYFLIPNHSDDGYLETILRNILKTENQGLLDCIDANEDCLRGVAEELTRPLNLFPEKGAEKAKLSYLRRLLKDLDNKNYKDDTIWDLNHPYLDPLKEFLSTHLDLH